MEKNEEYRLIDLFRRITALSNLLANLEENPNMDTLFQLAILLGETAKEGLVILGDDFPAPPIGEGMEVFCHLEELHKVSPERVSQVKDYIKSLMPESDQPAPVAPGGE